MTKVSSSNIQIAVDICKITIVIFTKLDLGW